MDFVLDICLEVIDLKRKKKHYTCKDNNQDLFVFIHNEQQYCITITIRIFNII